MDDIMFIIPSEDDIKDIINSIGIIISDIISRTPDIYEKYAFDDDLKSNVYRHFDSILCIEEFTKIYDEHYYDIFNSSNNIVRSFGSTFESHMNMTDRIKVLRSKEQPEQRTDAWYKFRYDHITASNAWKCFGNENVICTKCRQGVSSFGQLVGCMFFRNLEQTTHVFPLLFLMTNWQSLAASTCPHW